MSDSTANNRRSQSPSSPVKQEEAPTKQNEISALSEDVERKIEDSLEEKAGEETEQDPYLVDWDGPDDPNNPLNFRTRTKFSTMMMIATLAFLTYLAIPPPE